MAGILRQLCPAVVVLLIPLSASVAQINEQQMDGKSSPPPVSDTTSVNTGGVLGEYLREAARNNPGLEAEYYQYRASLEQVPQVSTLPDPELSFGYFISPIETRVGPQQARVGLTQMFPWFGTLAQQEALATQMAKAKFEQFQDARNQLFYQVQAAWYRLYEIDRSIRIMQENITILETFESLATRRYETAQVSQVDILRVQVEKEDLKTQLELLKDNYRVAVQEFNELLNRPAGKEVVITDSLQAQELLVSQQKLKEMVARQNSRLQKLDYQVSAARSSINVARKKGMPTFGLGVDYMITGERDMAMADNGRDAIIARGSIKIPLFRKKHRARERQAELELRSVQEQRHAAENKLQTQLDRALRDYEDAQRRFTLYQEKQIQRTEQAIDILIEEYANAEVDFEELLRLQQKLLDYELARETALVDQNTAVALVDYLSGKHNMKQADIEFEKKQ